MSTMLKIFSEIRKERQRQDERWPPGHDDNTWAIILTEEVGEAAREVLCGGRVARAYELRQELIQVAAVAVAWLEDIDDSMVRKDKTNDHQR